MDIPAPPVNAALSVTSHCFLNILPFADPHKQELGLHSCHEKANATLSWNFQMSWGP